MATPAYTFKQNCEEDLTYEFVVLDSVGNDITETVVSSWLTHDEEQELFLIETSSEDDIGSYIVEVSTTSQSNI